MPILIGRHRTENMNCFFSHIDTSLVAVRLQSIPSPSIGWNSHLMPRQNIAHCQWVLQHFFQRAPVVYNSTHDTDEMDQCTKVPFCIETSCWFDFIQEENRPLASLGTTAYSTTPMCVRARLCVFNSTPTRLNTQHSFANISGDLCLSLSLSFRSKSSFTISISIPNRVRNCLLMCSRAPRSHGIARHHQNAITSEPVATKVKDRCHTPSSNGIRNSHLCVAKRIMESMRKIRISNSLQ